MNTESSKSGQSNHKPARRKPGLPTKTNRPGGFRVMNEDIDMTTITRINTNSEELRGGAAPLYNEYPGQSSPQPAFIELDCEARSAEAKWTGEIGNAVPAYVRHKRALRFHVPSEVKGDAIADFLESEKFQALAQRICDGYEEVWDGSNHVGRYSDDATEAREELEQVVMDELLRESTCSTIVDPAEWWQAEYHYNENETEVVFNLTDGVQIRITSETSDKDLSELARQIEDATDDGVAYTSDVMDWLEGLRDNLFEVSDDDKE